MADYIDKKATIGAIHSAIYSYFCGAEDGDALSEDEKLVLSVNKTVCNEIKALPSADVQPVRHGRWMYKAELGWGETWVCSGCGERTTSTVMGKPRYKYCPMCGAIMDGD